MTCGSCPHTDGLCYTSLPPKVRCNITGEYHYYGDECNCKDNLAAGKAEEIEKLKELLNKPGALTISYGMSADSHNNTISGEEAAIAYKSLLKLPLYDECEGTQDNKISIKPYTSTIELDEVDKRLLELPYAYATRCLVCGTEVLVNFLGGGPMICAECKKAIKFIKEKFKEELIGYDR